MPVPGRGSFTCLLIIMLAALAGAQQSGSPSPQPQPASSSATLPSASLPPAPAVAIAQERPATTHAFWDRKNALLFAGVGAFRVLDYTSTRNMRDRGRQEILLTNWVVDNRPLFVGIEAAATGLSIGLSYVMHRTGHHKVERLISIGHISGAALGDLRNYALKSGHHYPQ